MRRSGQRLLEKLQLCKPSPLKFKGLLLLFNQLPPYRSMVPSTYWHYMNFALDFSMASSTKKKESEAQTHRK